MSAPLEPILLITGTGGARKGTFPVEFLGLEDPGKIGMHANCGTQSLIVYLRERMKKATVAAKRRKCGVGGEFVGGSEKRGKREVEQLNLNLELG